MLPHLWLMTPLLGDGTGVGGCYELAHEDKVQLLSGEGIFFFWNHFRLRKFSALRIPPLTLYLWCATIGDEMYLRRKTLKEAALEIPGILNTAWMICSVLI